MTPTITDNVFRVLRHYGLEASVSVRNCEADRVYCIPIGDTLQQFLDAGLADKTWCKDPKGSAEKFHGPDVIASYREATGCHPAMQVTMHADGSAEIDLDYAAPVDVVSDLIHFGEVAHNHLTRETTDQERVARMLDRRFHDGHNA